MILNIENLSFRYPNSKNLILENINLQLEKATYLSILGENGSGKTTLIKLLLNLYKPTSGTITCKAKRLGYVPQQKASFIHLPLTVGEFLSAAENSLGLKSKDAVQKALHAVGMEHKIRSLVGTLSGGELQRIFIAQALLAQPDLLLLDEPSTGVDVENQRKLYSLIRDLNKNKKITIIAVEHNLQAATHNSTEIFHLENGRGHVCSPKQFAAEYLNI